MHYVNVNAIIILKSLFFLYIATTINNISTDFRVGFGSFVDKRVPPFVSTNLSFLQDPCFDNNDFPDGCVSTYSYRHHVSLTADATFFNVSLSYLKL